MSDPATQAALREMARTIGGLESTVKTLVSTWQAQENGASLGRRDLHQKFDALRDDFHKLTTQVTGALKDIAEIKPSVEAFEVAREQARGAQKLGKWIWGGIGTGGLGLGGALGWMLANWITIGPKPPVH